MSAKFDEEAHNDIVSIVYTMSMHGRTEALKGPQQRYYIPSAMRCAGLTRSNLKFNGIM